MQVFRRIDSVLILSGAVQTEGLPRGGDSSCRKPPSECKLSVFVDRFEDDVKETGGERGSFDADRGVGDRFRDRPRRLAYNASLWQAWTANNPFECPR
ncbi:hypothetical protein JCM19992_08790 [Thermostilla marina]